MSKILLLFAPYSRPMWHSWIPLGLATIAGYLRRNGHEVRAIDYNVESISWKRLKKNCNDFKPNYVGISCTYGSLKGALLLAKEIKKITTAQLVLGGLPATFTSDRIHEKNKDIDIYVRGEGEDTFLELVNGLRLSDVLGISYPHNGKLVHNQDRPFCNNIDKFGIPAYDLFPLKKYNNFPKSMLVESLRGCPFACSFCVHTLKEGRRVRKKSIEMFIKELHEISKYSFIKRIDFADSDFFLDKKRAYDILYKIIEEGLHKRFRFHTITRIERLIKEGEKLIEIFKKANVASVFVGIEAVSEKKMKDIGKVREMDAVVDIVRKYQKNKIEIQPSYMIGYYEENVNDMNVTLHFAKKINAKLINVGISTPYPGTPFYQQCLDQNLVINHDLDYYDNQHQIIRHNEDLEKMLRKFRVDYYLRWSYLNINSLASFRIFNLLRLRTLVYYLYNKMIGNY